MRRKHSTVSDQLFVFMGNRGNSLNDDLGLHVYLRYVLKLEQCIDSLSMQALKLFCVIF